MPLITHWCVWSRVEQLKNLYQTDKGKHWCDLRELYVRASLLSKAVFTALVSMSYCLCWDWVWIDGGAKAVFTPKQHWLVPSLVSRLLHAHFGRKYVKRSHEITKKGVDEATLTALLVQGSHLISFCLWKRQELAFIAVSSIYVKYLKKKLLLASYEIMWNPNEVGSHQ